MSVERKVEGKKLPTYVKVSLIILGLMVGFLDTTHRAGVILAAEGALAIPIIVYREYWGEFEFWITVLLLAVLQAPIVIAVESYAAPISLPALLAFGISDCLFIIFAISYVVKKK